MNTNHKKYVPAAGDKFFVMLPSGRPGISVPFSAVTVDSETVLAESGGLPFVFPRALYDFRRAEEVSPNLLPHA